MDSTAEGETRDLPVFPLGTVLFPGMPLPLHIFELRYRLMLERCLEHEGEARAFVVCLIEEGDEVVERLEGMAPGQAAVPQSVGTVARIVETEQLPDGRSFVLCLGSERVRVRGIVDERPYLVGRVEAYPDEDEGERSAELEERLGQAQRAAERLVEAIQAALPEGAAQAKTQLRALAASMPQEPGALSYFLPRLLGSATSQEKQGLLEAPSARRRLEMALPLLIREQQVVEQLRELRQQSRRGDEPPGPFGSVGRPSVN